MNKIILYLFLLALIVFMSLFLPYESHDYYNIGLFTNTQLLEENVKLYGIHFAPAYIPGVLILITMLVLKIKQNIATSIIALVIALGNVFITIVIGILLVISFNFFDGGQKNQQLQIGYYIMALAAFGVVILLVIHMIYVIKHRKQAKNLLKKKSPNILDDSF